MSDKSRSERLRVAVRKAGGNQVVAARSGIPLGTLNNYLAGRDMKVTAFVALAAACMVSLDWLATGLGSENPEWHIPEQTPPESTSIGPVMTVPSQSPGRSGLREDQESVAPPPPIDTARLQQAIDIVKSLDGIKAFDLPNAAARIAAAYNILTGAKS